MARADQLPPNRKASERERAYFRRLLRFRAQNREWIAFWDLNARYEKLRREALAGP